MSTERLLSALERDFISARTKKIREDVNKLKRKFLNSKVNKIRRDLYEIENEESLSRSKIKEIKQNLTELEKNLYNANKYHNQDDIEYYEIRDIENLFGEIKENYYKPVKTISSFDNQFNYIEYESRGDKDKNLLLKEYLYMIISYLKDVINDRKTPMKLRVHSLNKFIDDKTQFGEWKIQLTMQISFISSLDSEETRTMRTKSDIIEIMIVSETDDIIKELIDSLLQRYQE